MPKLKNVRSTLVPIRLQVALHNYVNVEAPRKLYNKMDTNFCKLLPAFALSKAAAAAAAGRVGLCHNVMTDGYGALVGGS
jgi:hypothetical protein